VRWAPGVGIKNSEFIGQWDVDIGVAFIPWDKLPSDLNAIAEGSTIDEDSLPADFAHGICLRGFGCKSAYFAYSIGFVAYCLAMVLLLIVMFLFIKFNSVTCPLVV